jgi:hypothetical protein
MKYIAFAACLAALILPALSSTAAADEPPAWEHALRSQLLVEKQCNLNYLTNVQVQQLGAVKSIEARAHCMNGQAYDVRSLKGSDKFDIKECGISIC